MAEYYFDYKIERVFGDEKQFKLPKIYFERDYSATNLPYTMFAVPEEWLNKQNVLDRIKDQSDASVVSNALSELDYDKIKVVYDIKGIDCVPLSDVTTEEYRKAESVKQVSFEDFYSAGCRLAIESSNTEDHSGIGVIEMTKADRTVAKFFFAINFTYKKVINYSLIKKGKEVELVFDCKDCPKGVPVRVCYNVGRLPCLKNDMNFNVVDTFTLDFTNSSKYKISCKLETEIAKKKDLKLSVSICDEHYTKYYVLNCYENNTVLTKNVYNVPNVVFSCPYCHKPILAGTHKDANYRRGGTSCQAKKATSLLKIYGKFRKEKNCLYCAEDLKKANMFDERFTRLLPPDFMSHDSFKIVFTGSKRAGKTTYISRFFGIKGSGGDNGAKGQKTARQVSLLMPMSKNSMQKFGITVAPASIPEVSYNQYGGWRITGSDWTKSSEVYRQRAIGLRPSYYPQPTTEQDLKRYPFIAEVNKKAYVSFYDIAGETAQQKEAELANVANEQLIGVFCLINGKKDQESAQKVVDILIKAKLNPQTPIAILVTKMDTLEKEFDNSCHCLRSDYFSTSKTYEGSITEREIDFASEEIKSYLASNGLLPNFGSYYTNVKYFGVASFNFMDSIHNDLEDTDTPGKIKFDCSSKRMELPFVWMLKQFAIIN